MPTADDKLDRIAAQLTDLRVGVSSMAGDLRAGLARLDSHDGRAVDFEQRIRSLEKWRWSVPSAALVIAAASLVVTLYATIR